MFHNISYANNGGRCVGAAGAGTELSALEQKENKSRTMPGGLSPEAS
jgi:hypothetical protein